MQEHVLGILKKGSIDSHFHANEMKKKGGRIKEILENCFASGLDFCLDIAIQVEDFEERVSFAAAYPLMFLTAGLSPHEVLKPNLPELLRKLSMQALHPKVLAIGETGLDYYHMYGSKARQKELFSAQIEIAASMGLPIVIHAREADDDVIDIIRKRMPKRAGVIHCFSSNLPFAERCIEMGFYISFAGNITYKNAHELRQTARVVRLDRILVETDSPFLSPEPFRGKPNNPSLVSCVYECISEVRGIPVEDVIVAVKENAVRLFDFQR